jgi:hypothetical protein
MIDFLVSPALYTSANSIITNPRASDLSTTVFQAPPGVGVIKILKEAFLTACGTRSQQQSHNLAQLFLFNDLVERDTNLAARSLKITGWKQFTTQPENDPTLSAAKQFNNLEIHRRWNVTTWLKQVFGDQLQHLSDPDLQNSAEGGGRFIDPYTTLIFRYPATKQLFLEYCQNNNLYHKGFQELIYKPDQWYLDQHNTRYFDQTFYGKPHTTGSNKDKPDYTAPFLLVRAIIPRIAEVRGIPIKILAHIYSTYLAPFLPTALKLINSEYQSDALILRSAIAHNKSGHLAWCAFNDETSTVVIFVSQTLFFDPFQTQYPRHSLIGSFFTILDTPEREVGAAQGANNDYMTYLNDQLVHNTSDEITLESKGKGKGTKGKDKAKNRLHKATQKHWRDVYPYRIFLQAVLDAPTTDPNNQFQNPIPWNEAWNETFSEIGRGVKRQKTNNFDTALPPTPSTSTNSQTRTK